MSYALMKDAKVMCRGKAGVEWISIFPRPLPREGFSIVMTWPTREGAEAAARMQGAAVVSRNTVRL